MERKAIFDVFKKAKGNGTAKHDVSGKTRGTSFDTHFCIDNAVWRLYRHNTHTHTHNLKMTFFFIQKTRNHDRVFMCNFIVLYVSVYPIYIDIQYSVEKKNSTTFFFIFLFFYRITFQ